VRLEGRRLIVEGDRRLRGGRGKARGLERKGERRG
jgi:hypothetical protein